MEYALRNGGNVTIRRPTPEDAEEIISILAAADAETPFLARNPGEFHVSLEKEKSSIASMLESTVHTRFVAEYHGKLVGQCSVGFVRNNQRYRHRANVAFAVLKEYWGLGIGGLTMETCLDWCREHGAEQVELGVVAGNKRALATYQSFGFEITGTQPRALRYPDGSYADEYIMVKYLTRVNARKPSSSNECHS